MLTYTDLNEEKNLGYIKEVQHHKWPELFLYDYTRKTEEENHWNATTLNCRGIVIQYLSHFHNDWSTEIISRPFRKFFNHGDIHGTKLLDNEKNYKTEITQKIDGSMIVVSAYRGDLIVNTRGSFTSWQAERAKELLNEKYLKTKKTILEERGLTFLFEFTSPENTVVLPYKDESLTLIGINITAPQWIEGTERHELSIFEKEGKRIAKKLDTPKVKNYKNETLENIKALDKEGEEGFVVNYLKNQFIVKKEKIKFDSYVKKHKIISSLSDKKIVENLVKNKKMIEEIENTLTEEWKNHINKLRNLVKYTEEKLISNDIKEALDIAKNMTNKEIGKTEKIPNEMKSFVFLERKAETKKFNKLLQKKIIERTLKNL